MRSLVRGVKIALGIVVALFVLGIVAAAISDRSPGAKEPPAKTTPVAATPVAKRVPDSGIWPEAEAAAARIPDAATEPATLTEAIERYRTLMDDRVDQASAGTMAVIIWSAEHLKWTDVAAKETSPALARKDVDAERGKKLCTPGAGKIIEIRRRKVAGPAVFGGLLMIDDELLHFYAVGSTGTLVEGNYAKLCGVVTGLFDYHNSAGRIGHAVEVVGMFDLPENHAKH